MGETHGVVEEDSEQNVCADTSDGDAKRGKGAGESGDLSDWEARKERDRLTELERKSRATGRYQYSSRCIVQRTKSEPCSGSQLLSS